MFILNVYFELYTLSQPSSQQRYAKPAIFFILSGIMLLRDHASLKREYLKKFQTIFKNIRLIF